MENIFVTVQNPETPSEQKHIRYDKEGFLTHRQIPNYMYGNVDIYRTLLNRNTYNLILNSFDNIAICFFGKIDNTESKKFLFLNFLNDDIYDAEIVIIKKGDNKENKDKKFSDENNEKIKNIYFLETYIGTNFKICSTSKENLLSIYRNYKNKIDSLFFHEKTLPSWYENIWNINVPKISEIKISTELYNNCLLLDEHGLIYTIK